MARITMNLTRPHMARNNIPEDMARKITGMAYCLIETEECKWRMDQAPFESIMRCYQNGDLTLKEAAALIPLCNQAPWAWQPVVTKIATTVLQCRGWWMAHHGIPGGNHLGRELSHCRPDIGLRNIILDHLDGIENAELLVATILSDFSVSGIVDPTPA